MSGVSRERSLISEALLPKRAGLHTARALVIPWYSSRCGHVILTSSKWTRRVVRDVAHVVRLDRETSPTLWRWCSSWWTVVYPEPSDSIFLVWHWDLWRTQSTPGLASRVGPGVWQMSDAQTGLPCGSAVYAWAEYM